VHARYADGLDGGVDLTDAWDAAAPLEGFPGVVVPNPPYAALILLIECLERQRLFVRDLVDCQVLLDYMDPEHLPAYRSIVERQSLSFVARRLRRATAAAQAWKPERHDVNRYPYNVARVLLHEVPTSSATIMPSRLARLVVATARQTVFEAVSRRRLLPAVWRLEQTKLVRWLAHHGSFVYLIDGAMTATQGHRRAGICLISASSIARSSASLRRPRGLCLAS